MIFMDQVTVKGVDEEFLLAALATALDCLEMGILAYDHESTVRLANARVGQLLGIDPHGMIGRRRDEIPREAPVGLAEMENDLQRARLCERRSLTNTQGHLLGWLELYSDETARVKLETPAEEKEDFFRQLIDSAVEAIIATDRRGRITFFGGGAEAIFGYGAAEVLGTPVAGYYAEGVVEARRVMERLRKEGRLKHYRTSFLDKTGGLVVSDLSASLLRGKGGEVLGTLGVIRDVREVEALQRQVGQAEKFAALGSLASGLAHELRNPLAIVAATCQFCLKKLAVGQALREHLLVIQRNAEAANRIVKEMLEFVKPSPVDFRPLDVNEVLEETIQLIHAECRRHHIRVINRYGRELPAIQGDAELLKQTFLNLLMNAVQAMPRGGQLRLETHPDIEQEAVRIEITDNGVGIPREYLGQIFDPFFTTKPGGTGLGLSVSKRIVELHRGAISVESQPERGTKMILTLPVMKEGRVAPSSLEAGEPLVHQALH